jgi:hypothetical protein
MEDGQDDAVYYIAYIVKKTFRVEQRRENGLREMATVICPGVDLLLGPFCTMELAAESMPSVQVEYPTEYYLSLLHLDSILIEIIRVTKEQVQQYNQRHRGEPRHIMRTFPPLCYRQEIRASMMKGDDGNAESDFIEQDTCDRMSRCLQGRMRPV